MFLRNVTGLDRREVAIVSIVAAIRIQTPVKSVVRDKISVEENLFHQELYALVIWPLRKLELVSISQQG